MDSENMVKRIICSVMLSVLALAAGQAREMFPDSSKAVNNVELGVEGIARICPTGLWDHWTFRDVMYEQDSNTVVFVIQLYSWNKSNNGVDITASEAQEQTKWIVENIMKGYNALIESPRTYCEGDFMLYLSLGTLLKEMEKNGTTLRIMLLKPDYENLAIKKAPMMLTPAQLKPLVQQK